jgi:hypothetical protein
MLAGTARPMIAGEIACSIEDIALRHPEELWLLHLLLLPHAKNCGRKLECFHGSLNCEELDF